jgi:serine/threonine protein phosphatase PrpC
LSAVARRALQVRLGFATEKGRRPSNQDYVGAYLNDRPSDTRGIVAAIADGVGGHLGGREAAELTIRSFIDAYYALPETLGVQRAAFQSLEAINQWIHAQGRHDAKLAGMSCTFSALILRRRSAHILHVGDSRIYCLSQGRIERLTSDHVMGRGELAHVLLRAVGFEESIKVDHAAIRLRQHDRLLLCTDGVHGALNDAVIGALLNERRSPEESARAIVQAALDAPSQDNASALVIDVVDVPAADEVELAHAVSDLPILALPKPGDAIDEFILGEVISDGRYSRVFRASDAGRGPQLALKFPHPRVAAEASHRLAFVREAWVAARVRNPWIGEIVEPPAGRQTRLYSVMPFYDGETLERRLMRSSVRLEEGVRIAVRLSRALDGLHRVGVIHRDVKPDNVILVSEDGLRLVDLGVARVRGLDDFPVADIPGTPSYMAPELFHGQAGDEASDLYALGVTIYRSFTGAYPYGEIEPFMTPRFAKYISLSRARPDLPAWLDVVLAKAVSFNAANRFHDAIEFAYELEHGVRLARPATAKSASLYERSPVTFWKMTTLALLLVVIALVIHNAGGHLR